RRSGFRSPPFQVGLKLSQRDAEPGFGRMSLMQGGRGGSPPRNPRRSPVGAWPTAAFCLLLALAAALAPPRWVAHAGKLEELTRMLLEDDSYKVRVQAASLLGKLADPNSVGPLTKALNDTNKTVRWMAAQSL